MLLSTIAVVTSYGYTTRAILVEQYLMREPPGVVDYISWASQ